MRREKKTPELRALESIERRAHELVDRMDEIDTTLKRLEAHDFFERARSHWRTFVYQILLGSAFAVGTIMGLVLMSWLTYTYFKDTQMLRDVIDRQLRSRYFDLQQLRTGATEGLRFRDIFNSTPPPLPDNPTRNGSETVQNSMSGVR